MLRIPASMVLFFCITIFLTAGFSFSNERKPSEPTLEKLQKSLPASVQGWTAEKEDRFFDGETIFSYIDGHGEVYRAYNMQRCLARRYTSLSGSAIVLDIFDMGSSKNAYGVFTHDRDGDPLDLGQGALYRSGWLSFWKDRFFVSIYAEDETVSAQKTVKQLGRVVSSLIKAQGLKPRIVALLPPEGLQRRTIRYLHDYNVLNFHYYLSDQNILNLTPHTDAVFAEYRRGKESARLLLVLYPDAKMAAKAHAGFLMNYLPEADASGAAMVENSKWCAAAVKSELLAAVFEADSRDISQFLLEKVMEIHLHEYPSASK